MNKECDGKDEDDEEQKELPTVKKLTCLKDFYKNRQGNLEMLDGHTPFLDADPLHSITALKAVFGKKATKEHVLECGAGNGRVSESVLMEFFKKIDMIEPSDNLREAAIKKMKEAGQSYNQVFDCLLEDFQPVKGRKYDTVWI